MNASIRGRLGRFMFRITPSLRRLTTGIGVVVLGLSLFALLAAGERLLDSGHVASALLEESAKWTLIAAFLFFPPSSRRRGAAAETKRSGQSRPASRDDSRRLRTRPPIEPRREPARLEAATDRLFLALAAVTVFVATENMAYFLAFPESGIFLRLAWAEPVHIVAALAEAIGLYSFFARSGPGAASDPDYQLPALESEARGAAIRPSTPGGVLGTILAKLARIAPKLGLGLSGLAFGAAWHASANALASSSFLDSGKGPAPIGLVLGIAANATAVFILINIFTQRVIVGGFLHGSE